MEEGRKRRRGEGEMSRRGGRGRGGEEEEEEEESVLEAKNRVLGEEELLENTLFVLQSRETPFLSSEQTDF